jgi:hypothetical protein
MIFLPTALLSKRPSRSLLALKVFIAQFRILAASVLTQFRRGHHFFGDSALAYFFTRQSVHARAHVAQFQKPAAHGCFRSLILSPLPIFVGPSSCVRHQVTRVRVDCWIFFVVVLAASSHPGAVILSLGSVIRSVPISSAGNLVALFSWPRATRLKFLILLRVCTVLYS